MAPEQAATSPCCSARSGAGCRCRSHRSKTVGDFWRSGNLISFIEYRLAHPEGGFEIFLVADDEQVSTPEFIRGIAAACGRKARLFPMPLPALGLLGAHQWPARNPRQPDRLHGNRHLQGARHRLASDASASIRVSRQHVESPSHEPRSICPSRSSRRPSASSWAYRCSGVNCFRRPTTGCFPASTRPVRCRRGRTAGS